MIRVTVELWPGGDPIGPRKILGTVDIWNTGDHPEHPRKGHYGGRFWAANGRPTGREVRVDDHPRQGMSVFVLLQKILKKAGY